MTDDTAALTPGRSEWATVQTCTRGTNVSAVCLQAGAAGHSVRPQEPPDVPPPVPLQHLHAQDDRGQRGRAQLHPHQTVQQPWHQVHKRTLAATSQTEFNPKLVKIIIP